MASNHQLLLFFVTLACKDVATYHSYNPRYIDIFTSLASDLRNKRSDIRNDQADQLYLESLLSPFLPRSARAGPSIPGGDFSPGSDLCPERSGIKKTGKNTASLDVRFPSIHVQQDDAYMCTGYKAPFPGKESFIVKFTPHADMEQTHHMLVYGCHDIPSNKQYWQCSSPCKNKITLYAWARNAPELTLPKDVGYSIGGNSGIRYIVVQMHFAKAFKAGSCAGVTAEVTMEPQKYYAGIFLLGSPSIELPPHSTNVNSSAVCFNPVPKPMHVFAFRTHAHNLANVITGYRVRDEKLRMIGQGNPKWPQSFYPRVGGEIELLPGDVLAARCVYNNTRDDYVYAGPSGSDEMCNFYMMFYTNDKRVLHGQLECWGIPRQMKEEDVSLPDDVLGMPPYPGFAGEDSIKAIQSGRASIPQVPQEHLHMHGHGHQDDDDDDGDDENDEMDGEDEDEVKEEGGREGGGVTEEGGNQIQKGSDDGQAEDVNVNSSQTLSRSHGMPESEGLKAELDWPHLGSGYEIGAVGGLVADEDGNLHVFHRAGRLWTANSFDSSNRFTQQKNPIMKETVYHISKGEGKILHAWGSGQFFMPHGISLDSDGNMWLTDVALHQALKYPPGGSDKPMLVLGERFVPGSDIYHFCKPTDVAVDEEGMVYVSDGYCNGRVMKFAPDGSFITQWGRMVTSQELMHPTVTPPPGAFFVAHNVILCGPEKQEVCVADRENGRIQCFDRSGTCTRIIQDKEKTGSRVFAIAYSPLEGGVIYGVNGPDASEEVGGFTIQYNTGEIVERWEPSSNVLITDPHDITASPSGRNVYVGDLTNKKVYKFDNVPSAMPASLEKKTEGEKEKKTEIVEDEKPSNKQQDGDVDKKSEAVVEKEEKKTSEKNNELKVKESGKKEEPSPEGRSATIIIIILLVLPTIAILTAFICIRIRARRLEEYRDLLSSGKNGSSRSKLNLGKFLKRSPDQKGYSGVRSDDEDDENSESDVEVYSKNEKEGEEPQQE